MKYRIRHEIRGRIRLHVEQKKMTCREADTLLCFLETLPGVAAAKVYEQTGDAVVCYAGERKLSSGRSEPLNMKMYRCRSRCWKIPGES